MLQVNSAITSEPFDVCVTCFEHQAEPVSVVIRAVNSFGWKEIPKEIREAIRVYDVPATSLEGEYVRVGVWAERASHRQVVPRQPNPFDEKEEAEADSLLRKMQSVSASVREVRRRKHWFVVMLGFFRWAPA
ncbi:MAG: hypothetical protein ACR2QF_01300 [Geminicoccaceae bacterium]